MADPSRRSISDESPPALVDLLTRGQQQVLAEKLAEVLSDGYGEVKITVANGHVRFGEIKSSFDLRPNGEMSDD